jgi:hypothetical protein
VTGTGETQTRRAAGFLVVALEAGAIMGALGGGRLFKALGENVQQTLMIPAIAVTIVFFAILFGVPESKPLPGRSLDFWGFVLLTIGLLPITSGLTFLRINGPGAWSVYLVMLAGVATFIPWSRYELRQKDPAIDLRMLRDPSRWPNHDTVLSVFLNMSIAGLGSGALVGALPAAAPRGQTGIATALTNATKTIGGSFASAIFAIVLVAGAATAVTETASSLRGYLTVFAICGGGALVAAVLLFLVPKLAFADVVVEIDEIAVNEVNN